MQTSSYIAVMALIAVAYAGAVWIVPPPQGNAEQVAVMLPDAPGQKLAKEERHFAIENGQLKPRNNMSITNRDAYERTVQIVEGSGDQTIHNLSIAAHDTVEGLCQKGCSMILENGAQGVFKGNENVFIHKGTFSWAP